MFSEYMDVEKPLDSMARARDNNEKKDENRVDNNIHGDKDKKEGNGKDKNKKGKILEVNEQINGRVTYLTNTDPNNLNPKEKQYSSVLNAFAESMEGGIGQIDEKKIPGFHKVLKDGREAEVRCSENLFSLDITKNGEDGKQETLHIDLSNFKNNEYGSENTEINVKSLPLMTITGDIGLLDNNLKNSNDIVQIVKSIEVIMRYEIENVDGFQAKQENQKNEELREKKQTDYELLLLELDENMNNNPPRTNETIAKYIMNSENFDVEGQYLSARKTFLALCVLLRSYNNIQEIKEKILGNEKLNIQKAANTKDKEAGENIIEYLKNNPNDLGFVISHESDIVSLASNSDNVTQEERSFLLNVG